LFGGVLQESFSIARLKKLAPALFKPCHENSGGSLESWRHDLFAWLDELEGEALERFSGENSGSLRRIIQCASILRIIFSVTAEKKSGFSITRALHDIACGVAREDLQPAFYAELISLFAGMVQEESTDVAIIAADHGENELDGREAALLRSAQLDAMEHRVMDFMIRYSDGLDAATVARRALRRERIKAYFQVGDKEWQDWRWQLEHIVQDVDVLTQVLTMSQAEAEAVARARNNALPFGVTPHYLSLMDDDELDVRRDAAVRAQVLPPPEYVEQVVESQIKRGDFSGLDYMLEEDTSPVDLITRRYPAICIFKPFNTCPQICVYCQRNWEIEDAMAADALASPEKIKAAVKWISEHPTIREVLITGGDPLAMSDELIEQIVSMVAEIPTVERIRIGTRTLVTMPMRITERLATFLGSLRRPGVREVVVVTHVEHSYELTPEVAIAVDRLRRQGIGVYNQLVYTFFVSRRFEAAFLRRRLRQVGIDPYYSFNAKGKEETVDYRIPIARLLQEQTEEARLSPGIERTDEAVFNVPGQGKGYLRSTRQRQLIGIDPDGARVYEFFPWEDGIVKVAPTPYIARDVPILDYLERLEKIGEDVADYQSIWRYF
ncbi:MAG: KamA family radical SAM protein, partial [Deltaproteobacteria bacterium]|nr:KamA family radical SAM protein [Deltaproteobacteria bacterium]